MDTREVAKEYRQGQWVKLLQARASSGQSIKEFCESAGVSRNSYFYWQRKLREKACVELEAAEQPGLEARTSPKGWARLEREAAESALSIEVNGCCVSVTKGTDMDLLASVCRMLKTI